MNVTSLISQLCNFTCEPTQYKVELNKLVEAIVIIIIKEIAWIL